MITFPNTCSLGGRQDDDGPIPLGSFRHLDVDRPWMKYSGAVKVVERISTDYIYDVLLSDGRMLGVNYRDLQPMRGIELDKGGGS